MAIFSDPNSVVNVSPFSTFFQIVSPQKKDSNRRRIVLFHGRHPAPWNFHETVVAKERKLQRTEVQGWFQGLPRTWNLLLVSRTHTIPISLGIRKWEWYGNMGPIFSHVTSTGSLKISLLRSYMQILLKLFEQLLAPIVNGQPGEAEVAADLVALLGVAGNLGWSYGGTNYTPKELAAGSWKWWALVQMIFRNSTFHLFQGNVGIPWWNHVIFEVIIFWRSKGPTEGTLTFHWWPENFRLDVRKCGLWKDTLWFLSQSFNGRSALLQPTTRSKQIAIRFLVSLISGKSILHRRTWNVGVSWCISGLI